MPSSDRPGNFALLVQRYRAAAGLSQDELAERSALSQRGISDLERGRRRTPHPATVRRLAEALGLDETQRAEFLAAAHGSQTVETAASTSAYVARAPQPRRLDRSETALAGGTLFCFVGRQPELRELESAFDACLLGQGAVIAVAGEAGIGKTATCQQLAAYVQEHSGRALIGRCYEDAMSPPYLAFTEALGSWVRGADAEDLKSALGSGATELEWILPEVHERIQIESAPRSEPENDRWRLLEAVAATLRSVAARQPTLLVLEDLHDADRGTLDVLQHLARNVGDSRLLVAATYRDVEVSRTHPLSSVLAELRRTGRFRRIHLGGLSVGEVQYMASLMHGADVPLSGAAAIHRQTEGNPLFVQEIVRYLIESGPTLLEQGRMLAGEQGPLPDIVPEGLREVIGQRLSGLSESANVLLRAASVIGHEVRLDILQRVAGLPQTDLEEALVEATAAAVLEEQPGLGGAVSYRFQHAVFRRTLYEDMIAPRRMRMHDQVASVLEEVYATRLDEHAAELAAHLAHSSNSTNLARAVAFGERAAARALSIYAYGEAVRELDRALEVHDLLNSNDSLKRCDLLLSLGEALVAAGEQQRVLETVAPAALELALQVGDRHRAFHASEMAMQAMRVQRGGAVFFTADWQRWTQRADMYAETGTLERIHADLELAHSRFAANDPHECWRLANRGLVLARELQDRSALIHAYEILLGWPSLPQHERERQLLCVEFPETIVDELDTFVSAFDVWLVGANMLRWGSRFRAEELWSALSRRAARVRSAGVQLFDPVSSAILATVDGNLEEAASAGHQVLARTDTFGNEELARRWAANIKRTALLYVGRAEEALAEVTSVTTARAGPQNASGRSDATLAPEAALCFAHLGRREAAQRALQAHLLAEPPDSFKETLSTNSLTWLLEAAVTVGCSQAARQFAERLGGASAQISIAVGTAASGTCPARHLGAAAALLGDSERALDCYSQALEMAGKIRFRPELALTHLQIAQLLLKSDHPRQAEDGKQHLQFAIAELQDMHMAPGLQVALELTRRA